MFIVDPWLFYLYVFYLYSSYCYFNLIFLPFPVHWWFLIVGKLIITVKKREFNFLFIFSFSSLLLSLTVSSFSILCGLDRWQAIDASTHAKKF